MSKTQESKKDQSPAGKNEIQDKPKKKPRRRKRYREADYREYIRFIAFPKALREKEFGFKNDDEFAKDKKINAGTLSVWKKSVNFWDDVKAQWKKWGRNRTPDVILGLYGKAVREGNAAEALAWMKIVEDWKEKTETEFSMTRQTLQTLQDQQREIIAMAKKRRAKK